MQDCRPACLGFLSLCLPRRPVMSMTLAIMMSVGFCCLMAIACLVTKVDE